MADKIATTLEKVGRPRFEWDGSTEKQENGKYYLTHPYLEFWLVVGSEKEREILKEAFNEIEGSTATVYGSDF